MAAASHDTAALKLLNLFCYQIFSQTFPDTFSYQDLLLRLYLILNYLDLLLSPTNTNTIPTTASIGTGHQS